jgi:hypothetical protein
MTFAPPFALRERTSNPGAEISMVSPKFEKKAFVSSGPRAATAITDSKPAGCALAASTFELPADATGIAPSAAA